MTLWEEIERIEHQIIEQRAQITALMKQRKGLYARLLNISGTELEESVFERMEQTPSVKMEDLKWK